MKVIHATKRCAKEISKLMLVDLEQPDPRFPIKIIFEYKEHAKEKNILKEFNNPSLIAFLAIKNNKTIGFIVGYKKNPNSAMIHYISGDNIKTKQPLLKRFINECKKKGIIEITADTFEFMENNNLFKEKGFILIKKENITKNLEMLWYKLSLKKV